VIGSYIGLVLLGSAFTSIGLFTSSLGNNQIIAFTVALFLCFFSFSGFDSISSIISLQGMASFLTGIGINQHYQSVSRGVLDTRDLIYFLSFTALFLLLSKTIMGARKW
jgi:ABC-2 type transport system permease protein